MLEEKRLSQLTPSDVLCDALLPPGKDGESERDDLSLLRQKVIVRLLQQVPAAPGSLRTACAQLLRQGILTPTILPDVASALGLGGLAATGPPTPLPGESAPLAVSTMRRGPETEGLGFTPSRAQVPVMQSFTSKSRFEEEFTKLEMLGRGGFGEVWRCRHKIDNHEYAVKAVHYEIEAEYSDACQRLEQQVWREAQTWANMRHPNVVRYHNAWVEFDMAFDSPGSSFGDSRLLALPEGEPLSRRLSDEFVYELDDDDCVSFCEASRTIEIPPTPAQKPGRDVRMKLRATLYIQTELCMRDTLQTWLERRNVAWDCASPAQQRKWVSEACSIYQQCIAALSHLHASGCMHRDLKPSNILFGQDGAVRLGDFGLAKVLCGESQVATDDMQMVGTETLLNTRGVGTPTYASPEQMLRGCYGLETDIYALGVILAELLYPVSTQMERAVLLQSLRHSRCLPAALEANTPCAARLVLEMTDTDPAQRPSVGELLPPALLQEVCGRKKHTIDAAIGAKQRVIVGPRRSALSCRRWRRRRTRSVVSAVAVDIS